MHGAGSTCKSQRGSETFCTTATAGTPAEASLILAQPLTSRLRTPSPTLRGQTGSLRAFPLRQAGVDKRNGPDSGGRPPVPGGGRINVVNLQMARTATRLASAVTVLLPFRFAAYPRTDR